MARHALVLERRKTTLYKEKNHSVVKQEKTTTQFNRIKEASIRID
jgi:hypothetical protein